MTATEKINSLGHLQEYLHILEALLQVGADPHVVDWYLKEYALQRCIARENSTFELHLKYGADINATKHDGNLSILWNQMMFSYADPKYRMKSWLL